MCVAVLRDYRITHKGERMADKPIDREAVRRADAKLKQLLEDHPELREPNPERHKALEAWLEDHLEEEEEDYGEAR
jgi:hypothetical protein